MLAALTSQGTCPPTSHKSKDHHTHTHTHTNISLPIDENHHYLSQFP